MDNAIRHIYFEKIKNIIMKNFGISDIKKVDNLASLVENVGFNHAKDKTDVYISHMEATLRAIQSNKGGLMTDNLGEHAVILQQFYQALQGGSSSQPLMVHQQPNISNQSLTGHHQQQFQQPNIVSTNLLNHQQQSNHPSQPLMGNQQHDIQQPRIPSLPFLQPNQQLPNNPSQPFIGHQRQPNNPSPPFMNHQKQANNPILPYLGHQQQQKNLQRSMDHQQQQKNMQPSMGHQLQQKNQQPSVGYQQQQKNQQPSMGHQQQQKNQQASVVHQQQQKNQQPSVVHQQQQKNQQPSVGHQQQQKNQLPSVGHQQQQKNQQPSRGYQQQFQAKSNQSKKTTPKPRGKNKQKPTNQQGQPPSNPPPFPPASQIPQYQGPPAFNPPFRPNSTQPQQPHQQQNAFPGNAPPQFQNQFQAPRPPHYQLPHSSQLQLPQNPQNKQLQEQQGLQHPKNTHVHSQLQLPQNPQNKQLQEQQGLQHPMNTHVNNYQIQYPNHNPQYNFSHLQQNQLSHPSLPQQEHNQGNPRQSKRARKTRQPRGKPKQQEVKRDSLPPAPTPWVPQSSDKRSQQSSNTSQNVHKDEMALNSVVEQSDNQESKHTEDLNNEKLEQTQSSNSILGQNAAKENMGSIEIDMKEDLNNAKQVQTRPSISLHAQDTAKRDIDSMEIDMKIGTTKEMKDIQSSNSSNDQCSLENELGPIKHDMKETSIDDRSNRTVGSIQLDMKAAHNEELVKASTTFQSTVSSSVTEVANLEEDLMRLDEIEVNEEELEKAVFSASSPAYYAANQDRCSTGLFNNGTPDISSWPDITATQFEQHAAESSFERLVRQIKSFKPDTFRMAVKDIATAIEENKFCKVDDIPSIEQERWLQKNCRFANAAEESHCRDEDILELVQEEILAIRNKMIDISFQISKDEEENHKAYTNINPESVTDADKKNGIYVNLSYLGISLDQEYRALCKSQPKMQIKPLHLLIPPNYPEGSPIILEKYPEAGQFSEDFSSQAIAKFIESVRCVEEPITLAKIADIWNSTTREVMVSYAELRGGGAFTSTYSKWIYCDNYPNERVTPSVGRKRLRDWDELFEDD